MLSQATVAPRVRLPNGCPAQLRAPTADPFAGCAGLPGVDFSYHHDEEIYGEGEPAEFVYKVIIGAVRTYKLLSDGRRQIGAFHFAGELFGFGSGEEHRLTAEAVSDTTVRVYRRRSVEAQAARDADLACRLWTLAAQELVRAEQLLLLLGRKTAIERVATFLLEMETRTAAGGSIELPMPRRDIADYLGLTIETVSRTLTQLQAGGALQISGARRVVLRNRAMLRRMED